MIHGHSRHGSMIHGHHADMNRSRSGGSIMHSMHGPSRHGNAAHGHHNLGTSGRATDQFSVLAAAGRKLEVPFVAVRQGAQDGSYRYI